MVSLGLLVLLVVVIVVAGVRASSSRAGGARGAMTAPSVNEPRPVDVMSRPAELADDLSRWVALGLLSRAQANSILTHEQPAGVPATAGPRAAGLKRIPAIAEALGYLGGVLAVIGLGLIVARYWPDMATGGRLVLSGGGALVLVAAGALVHADADPAFARLRGFLWLGSTAALALFAGVAAVDGLGAEDASTVALACSGMVALESGLLWWRRERPLQQLTFLAGVCVVAGTAVAQFATETPTGVAVWIVGAAYVFLGLRRRTPLPVLTELAGAVAVVVGATITSTDWQAFGLIFAVTSASALVALAVVPGLAPDNTDQVVLGALGGMGLLQVVPGTLGYFSRDAGVATGLATWMVGGALVFAGVRRLTRMPVVVETVGGAAIIGGAALSGAQWQGFAPIFGIVTAVALVALGMLPGQVLLSVFGSIGLLINVPWAISWFFPGEGRAPLLIMVSGALIIGVAVLLARMGGRLRRELDLRPGPTPPSVAATWDRDNVNGWNVVVTVRDRGFTHVRHAFERAGKVTATPFYNVLLVHTDDIPAFLTVVDDLFTSDDELATAVSRVLPLTHTFEFRNETEFEQAARDVVLGWRDQLTGRSFHVRLHRRDAPDKRPPRELERELNEALLDALASRGKPGRIDFEDPDVVIDIETVGTRAGLSLWTRDDLEHHRYLRVA